MPAARSGSAAPVRAASSRSNRVAARSLTPASCHRRVTGMGGRTAAGGGRWVDVAPERLPRWLANFASRHGAYRETGLIVTAEDGASAEFREPPGVPAQATL